jgi:hypothetical protein
MPNARFKAGDGNLTEDFSQDFTITPRNDIISVLPNENQVRLKMDPVTGLVTGSFIHPASGRSVAVHGVVFTKRNRVAGYFLGPKKSGWVGLFPK